jgi:hypothetical protein
MRYVLLIYQAEEVGENWSEAERKKAIAGHRKMQAKAKTNGAFILTTQLMPSSAATTVRGGGASRPSSMVRLPKPKNS